MQNNRPSIQTAQEIETGEIGRLEQVAAQLAERQSVSLSPQPGPSPLDQIAEQKALLRDVYEYFVQISEEKDVVSGAAEWYLDNFYIIQEGLRQVQENMPEGYYVELPKLTSGDLEGYPRIYEIALQIIRYSDGLIDIDRITRAIRAYQKTTPLTMGEVWALPTMLRLGTLALLTNTIASATPLRDDEEKYLCPEIPPLEGLQTDTIIANCIRSLRTLSAQDWDTFFESVSRVDDVLRQDPAQVYSKMEFDTRDLYRQAVEAMAKVTDYTEEKVAQEAVALAERAEPSDDARAKHVGYYLLGKGRDQLEERIEHRPQGLDRLRRWVLDHPTPVYLGGIGIVNSLTFALLLLYAAFAGGTPLQLIITGLLALIPASVVAVSLVNLIVTRTLPPQSLPKLDFVEEAPIPAEYRTMVVIPALLSGEDEIKSLLRQLELHFLSTMTEKASPYVHFALLTDFSDAPEEHMPEDDDLVERAQEGIKALNDKYQQDGFRPFYLFHRKRKWNPAEDRWMGWERKRGKLAEFNQLILGKDDSSYVVKQGDLDILTEVKYVITLDADTFLPRNSARRLIGTLAHPLNQAKFDPDTGRVVDGYTILQPRTEVKPTSAQQSIFSRTFSGDVGLDLYTRAVSDVYQDLFGEGIYVGKGIYSVADFERSLKDRVPENALLSHDLFEGIHGRAGLVTDIILYEDYPPSYLPYAHRKHRWVRGDWQLLPWLFSKVPLAGGGEAPNPLDTVDRWKIFDNLRRSLRTPALLLFLIAGWTMLPGSPWLWTLIALLISAAPMVTGFVTQIVRGLQDRGPANIGSSLLRDAKRWLLEITFMPYESLLMFDAIATTLVRMTITHKRLLQWTTAAHTVRIFGQERKIGVAWTRMMGAPVFTIGLVVLLALVQPMALLFAAPILLAWLISPQIAHWISSPITFEQEPLAPEQQRRLRHLARRTWLYFEQFVGPNDHWLAPDHFQENPRGLVAHRTSPTNIGLMLLSTLTAHDLGYIAPMNLILRLRSAFDSMEELERYRGHFLNWYDTSRLETLSPRYVSTVDSGNLACSLLALRQGLEEVHHHPLLGWRRWQGFIDTLGILHAILDDIEQEELTEVVDSLDTYLDDLQNRIEGLKDRPLERALLVKDLAQERGEELNQLLTSLIEATTEMLSPHLLHDLHVWTERINYHVRSMEEEVDLLIPWIPYLADPPELLTREKTPSQVRESWEAFRSVFPPEPSLADQPDVCRQAHETLSELQDAIKEHLVPERSTEEDSEEQGEDTADQEAEEVLAWCEDLAEELTSARMAAQSLLIGLTDLISQSEEMAMGMDFSFLFDRRREVFYLGYRVGAGELDRNHYDLLASEARLASLIAIAKGDVPQSHWLHLSRPLTQVEELYALLSWNGSMFEYLMPSLMAHDYNSTLLSQTNRAVVRRQIEYADSNGAPWGISESGYYRFDANMNYQYQGFGVPGLGRKRGLEDDLVISSYASILALPVDAQAVMRNLDRLIKHDMLGHYGLYEAIDFTPSRLPLNEDYAIVQSYMAHHQGMILIALNNHLDERTIVNRFHADPRIEGIQMLLQEQIPQQAPVEETPEETVGLEREVEGRVSIEPWQAPTDLLLPQVHFLSNGSLGTMITNSGGGYVKWKDQALTRWRSDTTQDDWGLWIYVNDVETGDLWSVTDQPTGTAPQEQEIQFLPHRAEFRRREHDISTRLEVLVAPQEDVEIRRVNVTNHSSRTRRIALTSYGEVTLTPHADDRGHPAFNKMFIKSEYAEEHGALLFHRRPRTGKETPLCLAHLLTTQKGSELPGLYETDRARFLGRGHAPHDPMALNQLEENEEGERVPELTGTTGNTLDPVMAISQQIELPPHSSQQVAFITAAADSEEAALSLAARYRAWPRIRRAFDHARNQIENTLRSMELESADVARYQRLLSALLYPFAGMRAEAEILIKNQQGQSGLWPFGISGDYPILLVRLESVDGLPLVREALKAHRYWRKRQLKVDLVILNEKDVGYAQELNDQLQQVITKTDNDSWLNQRGGIFMLRTAQMDRGARNLLKTAARVILEGTAGSLDDQLAQLETRFSPLPEFTPVRDPETNPPTEPVERPTNLQFDQGLGGFTSDGEEYVIYLEEGTWTPAPWINVIANPDFGFLVSEAGSGYTWAVNSGENRLTPWNNDPVADTPAEALYLRDEETAEVWTPTPLPAGEDAPYLVRHGAGYSTFEHNSHGLKQHLRLFVAPNEPVKIAHLSLENTWDHNRRLTATYYAEWVLGTHRDVTQQYVVPEYDGQTQALLARNTYNSEFRDRVAFLATCKEPHGLTADRTEFLGRTGGYEHPAALGRVGLSGTVTPGSDPCAALQIHIELEPGERKDFFFILGQGADREETIDLIQRYCKADTIEEAWRSTREEWDRRLNTVKVDTPDPAMDLILNRWLPYQALSCRIWGRSALYQSSGAYGFRDQLQDVMSMVHMAPDIAREHILRAARHQFEEGDVLHWWHPPSSRGVRTHITDDLLWLPYVTAEYVEATGDTAVLEEQIPFRQGELLDEDEEERYGYYDLTEETASLYEHCCRALERGTTSGPHDLPLMGTGDWNDGMNRVGIGGEGESVWLGWFLNAALNRFIPLCKQMDDEERADQYRETAQRLKEALNSNAWDGDWYIRAFYDDGHPLGSKENEECQIDSIAQSWSILSGAGDPERSRRAMESVLERLVREKDRLLLLFTPPFDETPRDPGYIKGYPPGIRENGGQYTHAATWAVWAFTEMGDGDRAGELFRLLNPIYHTDTREKAETYQVEPYVVAADVYSTPPHVRHGGWTWYTGSSGWLYRLGLEALLGVHRYGDTLHVEPCIPSDWDGYEVVYRYRSATYHIRVENPDGVSYGVSEVVIDGETQADGAIPLNDDGDDHDVLVVMG